MESSDRLREETIGTVEMIRGRAAELEALAESCEAEAREQEQAVARLRARASGLRESALEYRYAALAIEKAPPAALGRDDDPDV